MQLQKAKKKKQLGKGQPFPSCIFFALSLLFLVLLFFAFYLVKSKKKANKKQKKAKQKQKKSQKKKAKKKANKKGAYSNGV